MLCNSKMGGPGSGRITGGKKTTKTKTKTKPKPKAQTEVGKKKVGGSFFPLKSNAHQRSQPTPEPKTVEDKTLSKPTGEPESEFQKKDRERNVIDGFNNLISKVTTEYEGLIPNLAIAYQILTNLNIDKVELYKAFKEELNLEEDELTQIFSWQWFTNARDFTRTRVFLKKGINYKTQVTKSYDILHTFCKTACDKMNSSVTKKDKCESISDNRSDGIINLHIKKANDELIHVQKKFKDIKIIEQTLSEYVSRKEHADILKSNEIIKGGKKAKAQTKKKTHKTKKSTTIKSTTPNKSKKSTKNPPNNCVVVK